MYIGQRPGRRSAAWGTVRGLTAAGLLAGLVATGCGAAEENSSNQTGAPTTTGTVGETVRTSTISAGPTSGPSSSGSGSGSGSSETPDNELAWAPFGPDDPKFPTPGWDVYYYFLEHNCQSLQNDVQTPDAGFGNLYRAAVAVCRAAVDGEQDQWSVASAAFADRGAGAAIGPSGCVDETISAMIQTLLAWHDQHPGRQPSLTFPKTSDGRTACSRDNNSIAGPVPDSTTDSTTTSSTESTTSSTTTTDHNHDDAPRFNKCRFHRLSGVQRANCQRTDLSSSSTTMLPLRRLQPSLSRKRRPPDSPSNRRPVVR